VLIGGIGVADAHHSSAMFDQETEVRLQGVVQRVDWANPHVYIHVKGETTAGEEVVWAVEAGPPNVMSRAGWSADVVSPGDRVIVTASPARDRARTVVLGKSLLKDDGALLSIQGVSPTGLRAPEASQRFVAESLSGRWMTDWDFDSAQRFLRPLNSWSLTDDGIASVRSYSGVVNPGQNCVPQTVPFVMVWPALQSIQIGDEVTEIQSEWGSRRIFMNVESHEGAAPGVQGHSIGSWDGDVLVVDTARFTPHRSGHGGGLPSGPGKHLVERFELSADRSRLVYTYEVEDPEYLIEPMRGSMELVYRPDLSPVIVPCDPEVARRYLDGP
jgi:hypothetical protein